MRRSPASRFQRGTTFVIMAILVASFVLPFGSLSVPSAAAQSGSLPAIDLTQSAGLVNQSQTHPMWGDLPVGPSGNLVMGRCGCLLSAFSTVVTHHLGTGTLGPSLSIPWFQVQLNSLVIDPGDPDIEHSSKTRKGPLELTSSFSPVYIDQYLQRGNLRDPYPPNWGYKSGFIDVCGGQVHYDALENLANPVVVYDEQGNLVDSSPSGVRLQWYDGYGADTRSIIDRNLLAGDPTIVGVVNPQNNEAHAYVIVGWDPDAEKYLVVDPADPVYEKSHFPEAAPPGSAERTYEGWEQMIKGIIDVQPVHHLGHSPLVLRVSDDPAPFELLAINPDGQRTGFDPATGRILREDSSVNYYPTPMVSDLLGELPLPPPERMLSVREPRQGTYRFLATATGDGDLILNFTTVEGPQLTKVGSVAQPITRGQTVKIEARSTGSAVESVVQVDNFTPEARAGNDVGAAVGSEVTFDARRSFDLDGDIVSYAWDFGDGASGTGSEPAHAYTQPGIYTVTLTVTDNGGATATATTRAIIGQHPSSQTTMVSVSSTGAQGIIGGSYQPSISADGRYVAFFSGALNLVPGDTNAVSDVFVRDHQTGVTTRVSVSSSGAQANGNSLRPTISADGRFVAFESNASNLISGDTNARPDIFIHDRESGTTKRVSLSSSGLQANHTSSQPAISADGRFVAFESAASNLVEGDTNAATDIFVHDRQTNTTERVSLTSDGVEGSPDNANALPSSIEADISADGRFATFESWARLEADDTNGRADIYVHDRQTGMIERISRPGDQGDIGGRLPAISGDGNLVAFVAGDRGPIVIHDRQTGVTEEVGPDGTPQAPNPGDSIAISYDGRFVAFAAEGNVLPGDLYIESMHVYIRDRQTGTLERVSVSGTGEVETSAQRGFVNPAISDDGRFIAFGQAAALDPRYRDTALVPDDSNNQHDVFLRDRREPEVAQPIANLEGPYLGWATSDTAPAEIRFTAEDSLGLNGLPLGARWDFGDGSAPVTTDDLSVSHSYSEPGKYTLTLIVSDDLAESELVTTTVEVLPPLPPGQLSVSPSCADAGALLSVSGYGDAWSHLDLREEGWNFADGPLSIEPVAILLPWQDEPLLVEPALPDLLFQSRVSIPMDLTAGSYEITSPGLNSVSVSVPCPPVANLAPAAHAGGPSYEAATGVPVVLDGSGSSDPEGAALTYHWDFGDGNDEQVDTPELFHTYAYPGVYIATLVVNDGQRDSALGPGTLSYAIVTVTGDAPPADSTPPTTSATAQTLDGEDYAFGTWTNQGVTLTLAAVDDEGGTGVQTTAYTLNHGEAQAYPAEGIVLDSDGTHTVTFWSVDVAGNVEPSQQVIVNIDRTAPSCTCSVTPNQLWPPNHQLVTVRATLTLSDGATGFTLVSVTSNEPDNGLGDGDTAGDIQGFALNTPDTVGQLRAERSGGGEGRVYTLTYVTVDQAGNSGTCSATVTVPHHR